MTSRERVKAAINFQAPDRLPVNESPWQQTVDRWHAEGLPADVSVADHFDFDITSMFIDASPRFEQKVIERKDGFITYEDRYGYTMRKTEYGEGTIHFISHMGADRESWDTKVLPRLIPADDPAEPARIDDKSYFGHCDPYPTWAEAKEKYDTLYASDRYMLFNFYGPWEAMWRMCGMENLLMQLALDPEWIEQMARAHVDMLIAVMRKCVSMGMKPDGIWWAEDLGNSIGPMFSPVTWDEVFRPHYARFKAYLVSEDIDFWMHSDGNIMLYLDRLIDVGVQVLNPLERKAGMDPVEVRSRVGNRMAMYGGINAITMAGPQDALEQDLLRVIPLAREGGYIMHSDHSTPPEVSFDNFRFLQQRAQEVFSRVGC